MLRARPLFWVLLLSAACAGRTPPAVGPVVVYRAASGLIAQATATSPPRLDISCDSADDCPESVAMVVFPGADAPERCTGALVGSDLILTAGHCLNPGSRRAGAGSDGWVVFPKSGPHPIRWHRVAEVVSITHRAGEAILTEDHALLRLTEPSSRASMPLADEPPEPGSIVTVAVVTPHPIYATQHRLRTLLCRVTSSHDAEQALGEEAMEVGWLSDCPIFPGNSGSPVLDRQGRIRALVHGGSHPFFGIGVTSRPPVLPAPDP